MFLWSFRLPGESQKIERMMAKVRNRVVNLVLTEIPLFRYVWNVCWNVHDLRFINATTHEVLNECRLCSCWFLVCTNNKWVSCLIRSALFIINFIWYEQKFANDVSNINVSKKKEKKLYPSFSSPITSTRRRRATATPSIAPTPPMYVYNIIIVILLLFRTESVLISGPIYRCPSSNRCKARNRLVIVVLGRWLFPVLRSN